MASMAPVPVEQPQVKPSFAKVAASAYIPQNTKEIASNTRNSSKSPQSPLHLQNSSSTAFGDGGTHTSHTSDPQREPQETSCNPESRIGHWANVTGHQVVAEPSPKDEDPDKSRPSITLVKSLTTDDSTTQLSSSDGSAKPPSLDGKSVASATTFALDEKESIRPDDSASLRAVEEEDVISPPDSVAAGSRVGSDSGVARAFRDQLHEISVMGPLPQRGAPPGRFQTPNVSSAHGLFEPTAPSDVARPLSQPLTNGMANNGLPHQIPIPAVPDEKLVEALESPRDRLFVLKLEQDFIDFVKDSNENELFLPNCNTFYRMLTHRLADYYLLGHVVDDSLTAVKISKTAYCRIPPPLSGLPIPSKIANTPPIDLPARKIMRRGDEVKSGTNTGANSEGPSKTTSEAGGASGSDGGNDAENKDKSAMTREEREARYKEARQRIFGVAEAEETEATDATVSSEEKDVSRSSSASGKKKTKKQRNYDDDGFEARSRFNVVYPPQYTVPGFSGDTNAVYYGGYPGAIQNQQYTAMGPNVSPTASYSGNFPVMMPQEAQPQYAWTGQNFQTGNGAMNYPNYNASVPNGYDLSTDFQRGMQSFQSTSMPSQVTPKIGTPPIATYGETFRPQNMPMNQGWPQMAHQPSYPMNQSPYMQSGHGDRPISASGPGPVSTPYAYGQFPNPGFSTGKPNRNQHPLPGSFNRQQFNPQSQAFVPGGRNGPFTMQPNMQPMPQQGMNGYGNFQMPRPSPPSSHPPTFSSPRVPQNSNSVPPKVTNHGISHPLPQPVSSHPTSAPPNTAQSGNPSVPAQSSIAKWGTPAHLPPKPPPPAQSKFTLPGHNFSQVARLPGTMTSGFSPAVLPQVRGGGGSGERPNSRPN